MKRLLAVFLSILVASIASGQAIDFGDDTSEWAIDGECDDPRFDGPGAAKKRLEEDRSRDASDCLTLFGAGQVRFVGDGAELFGALAVADGDDLSYGGVSEAASQEEADSMALRECRRVAADCSVVARYGPGMCLAIAGDDRALGWATGQDRQAITDDAIDQCRSADGESCRLEQFVCNGMTADSASFVKSVGEAWEPPADEICEAVSLRGDRQLCWVETGNQPGCWVFTERLFWGIPRVGAVNWSGDCPDGRAHGSGTTEWEWSNSTGLAANSTEQGVYEEGVRQGEWSSHVTTTGYREGILYEDGNILDVF